ncbi:MULTISPECIES: hypothetical protein [Rhodobacterales]|jgi:hypothetical protein|uniref:hypothetical protein n=1 Tax=Rhodobacterales TaxID=204455 RepID=UPI00237F9D04|nr:hypothetical protein [Phaeobacter gallaeciensis]MDE4139749.1 hypothetical protein [Phaeobacter gallaeciensis]MDE4148641.1 hypothetical protein [Phaeobacter gallaeciensis]MDE4152412.1 hypothetical protein [Phaeobacter gallaeciensis]MDE4228252.1 hypothetical protein [Phaeobacter gallaeciensis]MDE4256876.1 hypothetical protein [Phaeobacter gallaeciensis]
MFLKPDHVDIEQSAAKAISCQRRLRTALPPAREALPRSLRFAIEGICKLSVDELFMPHELDNVDDLVQRLEVLLRDVGGAPVVHHTEEGDAFRVGGTEIGRTVEVLIDCLNAVRGHAWPVSDQIAARAALGRLP